MKSIRRMAKPISLLLAILMITIFTPYQVVLAKMISTETVIESDRANEARVYVNSVLAREDVMTVLMSQGIDMTEAKARIDSLSDAEIVSLAGEIEQLPAGAGGIIFLYLLIALYVYGAICMFGSLIYVAGFGIYKGAKKIESLVKNKEANNEIDKKDGKTD
jgi:hypothetical protein